MKEIWKAVPSYVGMRASSLGRVWLPTCYSKMSNGKVREYKTSPTIGSISKANKQAKHKYRSIYNRKLGNLKVHRLVCEAFHGPKPFENAVVMHLDENGLNNNFENLKWGTQKENLNAIGFKEYCRSRVGDESSYTKGRKLKNKFEK